MSTSPIIFSGYYEAASSSKDRDWGASPLAPEDVLFSSGVRAVAIARMRREVRNNPLLAAYVRAFPQAIGTSSLRSRTSSKAYNTAKDLFWFRWSKLCEVSGLSLRGMERIAWTELLISGEFFVVLLANGKVQLIASEFCGSPTEGREAGELNGIVRDTDNRPTAYRFASQSDGGQLDFAKGVLVEARNVIHVYDRDRVRLGRGIPWMLPAMTTARDLWEIMRAKSKQVKTANSVFATIEKHDGADGVRRDFGDGYVAPRVDSAGVDEIESSTDSQQITLANGEVLAMKPGEKLNITQSSYNAADYKELVVLMAHTMSGVVGMPVELWFIGFADASFAGFKAISAAFDDRRREYIDFFEDNFLDRLQFWRASKAAKENDLAANPDNDDDLVDWSWGAGPVLDIERKAKANSARLASGECSLAEIWEEAGKFSEEVFENRRQEWIKLQVACGNVEEGSDYSKVIAPECWMLRGELPGDTPADQQFQPAA